MTSNSTYLDDLVSELRLLDVPGKRIGQIMAEAESHLAESGEDPVEAFGTPAEYARELTSRKESVTLRDVLIFVGVFALTAASAALIVQGIFGLTGRPTLFGWEPVWLIVIGVIGLVAFLVIVKALTDPVVDPRTGREVKWDGEGRRR